MLMANCFDVDMNILGISVPDYSSRSVETIFLEQFWIFYLLVVNNNKYFSKQY